MLIALVMLLLFFSTRASAMQVDSIASGEAQETAEMQENAEAQEKEETHKVERVAIKNNLLYDAAATPNLELEIMLAPKWSLELGVGFNPFPLDDTKFPKWRHLSAWIAPRYWFCNVFNRGFVSINAAYALFNVAGNAYPVSWMYREVKEGRYEGHAVMAGASGGWHFPIKPYFSIELEGGIDAGYAWYKQYECKHCGDMKDQGGRWLILPKLAVNLVFPLGGDEQSLAKRCDCEKLATAAEAVEEILEEPVSEPAPIVLPPVVIEPEPVEPIEPLIPAERIQFPMPQPEPVIAVVPPFEVNVENSMRSLRNRLLRDEEEYEPYDRSMALSADPRNVFLYFDVDVTKMDRSFIQNDLLMDSIMNILGEAIADTTIRISHIRIVGFASFDGRLAYNEGLAGSRAQTIKEYMQSLYPELNDSVFAVENGGESWAELKYQLKNVEFNGRDEVLQIMDSEGEPDAKEAQIKKLNRGATYRYMRDELKKILRNLGCITIYCETK